MARKHCSITKYVSSRRRGTFYLVQGVTSRHKLAGEYKTYAGVVRALKRAGCKKPRVTHTVRMLRTKRRKRRAR